MTIHLTPEQERRIRAVLDRGAYKSVEELVEHAKNSIPCSLKGLPQNNSRKMSFRVP